MLHRLLAVKVLVLFKVVNQVFLIVIELIQTDVKLIQIQTTKIVGFAATNVLVIQIALQPVKTEHVVLYATPMYVLLIHIAIKSVKTKHAVLNATLVMRTVIII